MGWGGKDRPTGDLYRGGSKTDQNPLEVMKLYYRGDLCSIGCLTPGYIVRGPGPRGKVLSVLGIRGPRSKAEGERELGGWNGISEGRSGRSKRSERGLKRRFPYWTRRGGKGVIQRGGNTDYKRNTKIGKVSGG